MELDWDLHAVVRGCSSSTTTTASSSSSSSSSGFGNCGGNIVLPLSSSAYPFEPEAWSSSIEELHELCKPFFTKLQPQEQQQQNQQIQSFQASSPLSSSFSYSSSASPQPKQAQPQQQPKNKHPHPANSVSNPRSKRRKNQLKRVCQVPVENLSSDVWAWRKYGQKPIKGSPYPRGYYRCSSSKGCLARKQVERNRSDPTMFIVTYTAEHNHPAPTHRNSLAGSTRQKPLTPQGTAATAAGEESEKALTTKISSSPATSCGEEEEEEDPSKGEKSAESMEEEKEDGGDEEGDDVGLSDMVLPDDFFECLDELGQLTGTDPVFANGDCFNDPFSAIAMPSWVANSAATAAGGR